MSSEFDKTLSKLSITFASKELTGTPAQGFTAGQRYWRVSLARKMRGEDKPLRLTLTLVSPQEPNAKEVVKALAGDIRAAELSLWDFAQTFVNGEMGEGTERMHKNAKRIKPRVAKFFGEQWGKVVAFAPKAA